MRPHKNRTAPQGASWTTRLSTALHAIVAPFTDAPSAARVARLAQHHTVRLSLPHH
jgi:hypothetical protein